MTRLNGTYLQRFFHNTFIYFIPATLIFFFIPELNKVKTVLILFMFCFITLIFGSPDYIKIKINIKLVNVKFDGNEIIANKKRLTEHEIISITPITINHGKWNMQIMEIKTLKDTYYFLDKSFPLLGDLTDKKSKSVLLIEQLLPSISSKINERIILRQFPNKLKS